MMALDDIGVLLDLVASMKTEACLLGRFPRNHIGPQSFDARRRWMRTEGFRPFRCIAYNQRVRQINALRNFLLHNYPNGPE
jgi:hypothetical protein